MKTFKVLISFILTCVCLYSINHYSLNSYSNKALKIKNKSFWINKVHFQGNKDILIFGDSRTYRGINPEVDPLKRNNINLGFSSAGLSPNYIETSLKRNNSEETILLLGITAHSFSKVAFQNSHWNEFRKVGRFDIFLDSNENYLKGFTPFLSNQHKPQKDSNYIEKYNLKTGFVWSDKKTHNIESGLKIYKDIFRENKFSYKLLKETVSYLNTLKNRKIYAFIIPTNSKMITIEKEIAQFDEVLVKTILRKSSINVIEIPESLKSKLITYDGSHLTGRSANILSEFIFSKIK